MTVSKTARGGSGAVLDAAQNVPGSSLDGRPRALATKADLADGRVRRWLKSAHRSFGSWAKVAAVLGISSKGKAQHIAEGRAAVTDALRCSYAAQLTYVRAGRALHDIEAAILAQQTPTPDAIYDNRGREVTG